MAAFRDNAGHEWVITVTVDAIKRVRSLLQVDLVECVTGDLWSRIVDDPVLLANIVYVLCKPQADTAKVSDEDFGKAMFADPLAAALEALQEELVNFFPSHQRVALVAKLIAVAEKVMTQTKADRDLLNRIASTPPEPGVGSSDSPGSSGSTPAP
jgi:hypothetical protein